MSDLVKELESLELCDREELGGIASRSLPALIEYVKAQDAVWEACEGAPIYAAKRLESAESALLAALRGGK